MRPPELPAILGRDFVLWLLGIDGESKIGWQRVVPWYHGILRGILDGFSPAKPASADSCFSTQLCHVLSLVLPPAARAAKVAIVARPAIAPDDAPAAALTVAESRHVSRPFQNQMSSERENQPYRTAQTQQLASVPARGFLERAPPSCAHLERREVCPPCARYPSRGDTVDITDDVSASVSVTARAEKGDFTRSKNPAYRFAR